ncbi:DMT family transporter [Denitrobaculum tricleocarpae]|uniref:DMT family transporter n=1 Tax=Denitrobaculum tricleocarpae TaxID=2591009 RepID=UPI001C555892|nr:DMT family transporter [Denitrobaculum tricleocarpae]
MKSLGSRDAQGLFYGLIGVLIFGLTLPTTRIAVAELDPVFVGLGRALPAALCAGLLLLVTRTAIPARRHWWNLAITSGGIVFGFPVFATIAMATVPAAHGGVVLAILPLATAVAGSLFGGERPSLAFWFFGLMGAALVFAFVVVRGGGIGGISFGDLLLVIAVICAAVGYAKGGVLARDMAGWRVICWALVIAVPFLLLIVLLASGPINWQAGVGAWSGFFYVALFSQFLGFFAWNHGLALGGIARVGQLQLLQPFVTLLASALLLAEAVGWIEIAFALAVVASVMAGRRTQVRRVP